MQKRRKTGGGGEEFTYDFRGAGAKQTLVTINDRESNFKCSHEVKAVECTERPKIEDVLDVGSHSRIALAFFGHVKVDDARFGAATSEDGCDLLFKVDEATGELGDELRDDALELCEIHRRALEARLDAMVEAKMLLQAEELPLPESAGSPQQHTVEGFAHLYANA